MLIRRHRPRHRQPGASDPSSWLTEAEIETVRGLAVVVLDTERSREDRYRALDDPLMARVLAASSTCDGEAEAFVRGDGSPPVALASLAAAPPPGVACGLFAPPLGRYQETTKRAPLIQLLHPLPQGELQ